MAAAASATAAWPPTLEHRFAQWLQTKPRGMDAPLAAAVAQHAHWLLRRLRAAGLGAATEEEEGARAPPSLVAHDGPSLQAYFHTHGLFPCPPSASHAAVRAADKTPGAQAVRALIAVGDAGWMRRQRNYLLLLKFAATAAATVEEPGAGSGEGSSGEEEAEEEEGAQQQAEEMAVVSQEDDGAAEEEDDEAPRTPPPPPTPPRPRVVQLTWAR